MQQIWKDYMWGNRSQNFKGCQLLEMKYAYHKIFIRPIQKLVISFLYLLDFFLGRG